MKKYSNRQRYSSIQFFLLIVFGMTCIVLIVINYLKASYSVQSALDICNTLITFTTLIVLCRYAFDTHIMASETKRMAKIQNDAQFYPSIGLDVTTRFLTIEDGYYEFSYALTNNTRYPITVILYTKVFWFDQLIHVQTNNGEQDEIRNEYIILPSFTIKYDLQMDDNRTQKEARASQIAFYPMMWVNHIRSPYYLGIRYKANNAYMTADFSEITLYYNLQFKIGEELRIMAEPANKYSSKLGSYNEELKREYIRECIKYASDSIKSKEWTYR